MSIGPPQYEDDELYYYEEAQGVSETARYMQQIDQEEEAAAAEVAKQQIEILEQIHLAKADELSELYLDIPSGCYIPEEIRTLRKLTRLGIDLTWIRDDIILVPLGIENLKGLKNLQELYLTGIDGSGFAEGPFTVFPPEICDLKNLKILTVDGHQLTQLPPEIGNLTNLTHLYLFGNQLTSLPVNIGNLHRLEVLSLPWNQLSSLPSEIGNLKTLKQLHLKGNNLTALPSEIGNLTNLTEISLDGNQFTALPPEIGNLTNLTALELCDARTDSPLLSRTSGANSIKRLPSVAVAGAG